jgi:rhs element vgr protein
MTTNVGMNISASAGMNYTQIVGVNFVSTVAGNAITSVIGALNEFVYGDRVTKAKRIEEIGVEGINKSSENSDLNIHGKKNINTNSGEKSINF